jgi:trk system potassium uptake protein TrkH
MANGGVTTLSYPVRGPVLLKYLGQLGLMLAILTIPPLSVSIFFAEYAISGRYLIIILALLLLSIPLSRLSVPTALQANEALTITALAFLFSPLFMTYPLMGTGLSFQDAWFEAISGITTTGLSVLSSVENQSPSLLFARAWMQWYGGLGIAILSVALLMGQSIVSKKLVEPVPGENLVTTTRTHARRVLTAYVLLTTIGIVFLLGLQVEPFHAITLTLTAISTGGFSPFNDSLAGLDSISARSFLLLLCLCGSISLPLYAYTYHHGFRRLISDVELPALLVLCTLAGITVGLSLGHHTNLSWTEALAHGAALGVSAQTGTGFSTVSLTEIDQTSKSLLMASMFIGGSVGSTAGGIKIFRFLIVLVLIRFILQRACAPPHAVVEPWLGTRRLEYEDLTRALLLTLLFIGVIVISWILFLAGGYDPLNALFEVTSATGTVGLSTGITGTELPGWLKGVLCFDMLAGRLEIFALLMVFYPPTWRERRTRAQ